MNALESMNSKDFILSGTTLPFRTLKRKGELRYIASPRRGSLTAVTRFAPPSKSLPKLILRAASLIDFRIPAFLKWIEPLNVSEDFLRQVSALLDISIDRIGVYVGEPNNRCKLVVCDIYGESKFVLKIAVGSEADKTIVSEEEGIKEARSSGRWAGMVPEARMIGAVCGKRAVLVERIPGRQLTPKEFEKEFFEKDIGRGAWGAGESVIVGDWVSKNLKSNADGLKPLIDTCRQTGVLDESCPLGVVHGDFSSWNIIRRLSSDNHPLPSEFCAIDWEFSRNNIPLIFDVAYAAWCYSELLGRTARCIDPAQWKQLVALGALWKELRLQL